MPERVQIDWDDLADLDLDPDNPRHELGMSRREIIRYLVEKESVLGLAKDVAEVGLSPLDIFGAIAAPEGGYTIVEGNRRLCALILLHDPSLAPSKERRFPAIASGHVPEPLTCATTCHPCICGRTRNTVRSSPPTMSTAIRSGDCKIASRVLSKSTLRTPLTGSARGR